MNKSPSASKVLSKLIIRSDFFKNPVRISDPDWDILSAWQSLQHLEYEGMSILLENYMLRVQGSPPSAVQDKLNALRSLRVIIKQLQQLPQHGIPIHRELLGALDLTMTTQAEGIADLILFNI